MNQNYATPHTAIIAPTTSKTESTPKQFVRRLIQKVAPIKNARVRYDVAVNQWALLDEKNEPIRHFTHGYMEDVRFTAIEATERIEHKGGCNGGWTENRKYFIGVAQGTLREGVYSPNIQGLQNLSFKGGGFCDIQARNLRTAKELQLMPDRRALYLD